MPKLKAPHCNSTQRHHSPYTCTPYQVGISRPALGGEALEDLRRMLEDQKTSVGWMRQEVGRLEAELQGVHAENAYLNRFEATPHPQRSPPSPLRRRTPKGSPLRPPPPTPQLGACASSGAE